MLDKDEEDYRNNNMCRFCEKNESDKVRNHCQMTVNFRGPAHSNCNINLTHKQSTFIPSLSHNFSNCDCPLFFKK